MKILYDFQNMIGGAPRSQLAHMLIMHKQGHEVIGTIGTDNSILEEKAKNIKVIGVRNFNITRPFHNIKTMVEWFFLIRNIKPDIIYSNRITQFKFLAVLSDFTGVPLVFAQAGGQAKISDIKPMKGKIPVVYSIENKNTFEESGFLKKEISVISNRIPFHPNSNVLTNQELDEDMPLKILCVGNIKKDTISGLIKFFEKLINHAGCFNVSFTIELAGEDISPNKIYQHQLEKLIKEVDKKLGRDGKVKLIGWIEDIEKIQAKSDIIIGKGRSVIQPSLYGKVCFVLSETGNLTQISNENFHNLYKYNFSGRNSQNDNFTELINLLKNISTYKELSLEANLVQSKMREAYSEEFVYPKLIDVYKNALNNKQHAPKGVKVGVLRFMKIYCEYFKSKLSRY